jgi:hypothetical protein
MQQQDGPSAGTQHTDVALHVACCCLYIGRCTAAPISQHRPCSVKCYHSPISM